MLAGGSRRVSRVAYLYWVQEFWSLELEVTPDVLVPRPETELAVERVLAALGDGRRPAVLDLGTGSGAIALAVADERPDAAVTATDVSAAALAVAQRNATRLGLRNLRFLEGSWFDPLAGSRFDAIVSNPPYVAAGDPALVALAHEPRAALLAWHRRARRDRSHRARGASPPRTGRLAHRRAWRGPGRRRARPLRGRGTRRLSRPGADLAGHERVTEGTLAAIAG